MRGERLTSWAVSPCGEDVRIGFEDTGGEAQSLSLRPELLSALMLTIPRMLRRALDARFGDGSLRLVHRLGDWRLEQGSEPGAVILTLATADGFEVAFALPQERAGRLAAALQGGASRPVPVN